MANKTFSFDEAFKPEALGQVRDPTQSEIDFFLNRPEVGAMMTEDGKVIVNPNSNFSDIERDAIIRNERSRLLVEMGKVPAPSFELTPEQQEFLDSTDYKTASEQDRRATIAARALTGDKSALNVTQAQRDYAKLLDAELKTRGFKNGGDINKEAPLNPTAKTFSYEDAFIPVQKETPTVEAVATPKTFSFEEASQPLTSPLAAPVVKPEDTSFGQRALSSIKQGFESFGSASEGRELGRLKEEGKLPEATAKMEEIKTKAAEPQEPTLSARDIQRIAHEKGYLPATMQVPSFVVEQILKSGPEMAESLIAGYAAGALTTAGVGLTPAAPFAPVAGAVVGTLAGMATYGYQQYGHFLNTQALTKQAPEELDVDAARNWAAATAPIGFIADKITVGAMRLGSKAVGEAAVKELTKRTTGQVIKETAKAGATQAAVGIAAEAPTEVLEQMAERYQAGLPLDNAEANEAYFEAFWGAAGVGGGIGGSVGTAKSAYNSYKELKNIDNTVNEVNKDIEAPPAKERPTRETKLKESWERLSAKGEELRKLRELREQQEAEVETEVAPVETEVAPVETEVAPVQVSEIVDEVPSTPSVLDEATQEDMTVDEVPSTPGVLDEATLTSLGLNKRSNAFKELIGVDLNTNEGLAFFDEILDNHTGKINETAVGDYIRSIAPIVETINEPIEATPIETTGDRAGVSTLDEQRSEIPAERAVEADRGTVDVAGVDVGQPARGTEPVAAPLAEPAAAKLPAIKEDDIVYNPDDSLTLFDKTINRETSPIPERMSFPTAEKHKVTLTPEGYLMFKRESDAYEKPVVEYLVTKDDRGNTALISPNDELFGNIFTPIKYYNTKSALEFANKHLSLINLAKEPEAAVEEAAAPEAIEAIQPVEEPQGVDLATQAKPVIKELLTLDPTNPLIEDLRAYDVNEETIAFAQEQVNQLVQERQAKGQTQPSELRELSEEQAIAETAPVEQVAELEIDPDKYLDNTKAELGDVIRRVFPVTENIVPEERASIGDLLKAIANLMHAFIRKGVKSMGQAIKQARGVMGQYANRVTPAQYRQAYTEAAERPSKAKKQAGGVSDETLLKQTGTKPTRPPKPLTGFQRFKTSPVQTSNEILRKFTSYWASFDNAINNKILDAMRARGVNQKQIADAFYLLQVTQAVRADNMADSFLERGDIAYDSSIFKFVITESKESMKAIRDKLDELAKANGINLEQMHAYASAAFIARRSRGLNNANVRLQRRVVQLVAQGKSAQAKKMYDKNYKLVNMTQAEINAGLEFFNRYPEFNDLFDTWNEVREKVLDFAMDQGLLDQDTRDQLLEVMDYVPFFRVEQLEAKAGPKEYSRGLIDTINVVRKMKGSNQEVNDVFDNMERWIKYTIAKGVNNRAAQEKIKLYKQELPNDIKALKDQPSESGNTVSIFEDGKLQRYEFQGNDGETMVHGFTGLEPVMIPALSGWWSKATSFLRLNIVLQPFFSLAQIPQDMFSAMFVTGVKTLPLFTIPLQVMKEILLTPVGLSSARKRLKETVTVGRQDFSREYQRMDSLAEAESKKYKTVDKLIKAVLSPLSALSMASDNVIRQAVYSQIMLETKNEALAINAADELINFRRSGYGQAVNIMRQLAPFVNANLQALHIQLATITGKSINPITRQEALYRLISTGGQLAVASLIYAALMSDEDEYKKLDPSERDRNIIMPNGFKLPMRNDLFTVFFKIMPEHVFNRYVAETEDGTKMAKALSTAFKKALAVPGSLPSAISPIVESYLNIDMRTGRPIVGQGQAGLTPEQQIAPRRTTQLARLLGELGGISPLKIDQLFQGYFGATASIISMLTNSIIADIRGEVLPTKTAKDMALEFPFVSSFITRENGARNMMDYYELQELVNEAYKSYSNLYNNNYAAVQPYLDRDNNRELVLLNKNMRAISDELANLRSYENRLLLDKTKRYTADEKRAELDRIEEVRQNMLGFELELNDRKDRYIQQMRRQGGL